MAGGLSIFIILIGILIYRLRKPSTKPSSFSITRRTHFVVLSMFIALLVLLTIIAELMEPHKAIDSPFSTMTPSPFVEEPELSLDYKISNGEAVDSSLILEKRTHPAGKTLTIQRNHPSYEGPYVYVERKSGSDQTIEEILYKPFLSVNDYDLSDTVNVTKPVWTADTVMLSAGYSYQLTYVTFNDANLLNQLTQAGFQIDRGHSYGSTSRPLIMHLIVPEDLEIIDTHGDESIYFIE